MKRRWVHLGILFLIILAGLSFRWYHLDYPVVGYHNWKETHYLTEARNFAQKGFFEHGFFMPEYDYPRYDDNDGVHVDSFPTISVVVGLLFRIFGESLFIARLTNIFFNIMVIPLSYLLIRELFEDEFIALLTALMTAINPLFVFFSHNTQLINPGVFFMMLCLYLYVKWHKSHKSLYLILATASFVISFLTKYSFFTAVFPILFTFPYKKLKNKNHWKTFGICFLIALLVPAYLIYTENYGSRLESQTYSALQDAASFDFGLVFRSEFWTPVKSYINDNYTIFGFWLAILGMIASVYFYSQKKSLKNKFLLGSAAGIVAFTFIVSHKLRGHNYHQYPIAPLMILFISYFIYVVSKNLGKIIKSLTDYEYSHALVAIVFVVLIYTPSLEAWERQFNTQFPGLDIAGEYIREHSSPEERLIFSGHQSYGVLWHSGRKGYVGHNNVSIIRRVETEKNARWIFVYQWGFSTIQDKPGVWKYIEDNYALRQVAFQRRGQDTQMIYLLLEKGGDFSVDNINQIIQGRVPQEKYYEMTIGEFPVFYFNLQDQS